MAAIHVTDKTFEKEVIKSQVPVLVDFWAQWCGPCRMLGPVIEELAEEYEGRAKICKVDVDENEGLAEKYGIMSIPTVFVFNGGKAVEHSVGVKTRQELKDMIDKTL